MNQWVTDNNVTVCDTHGAVIYSYSNGKSYVVQKNGADAEGMEGQGRPVGQALVGQHQANTLVHVMSSHSFIGDLAVCQQKVNPITKEVKTVIKTLGSGASSTLMEGTKSTTSTVEIKPGPGPIETRLTQNMWDMSCSGWAELQFYLISESNSAKFYATFILTSSADILVEGNEDNFLSNCACWGVGVQIYDVGLDLQC